jgi:hypothetical protein
MTCISAGETQQAVTQRTSALRRGLRLRASSLSMRNSQPASCKRRITAAISDFQRGSMVKHHQLIKHWCQHSNAAACLQGAHPPLRIALHHCADTDEAVPGAVDDAKCVVLLLFHALILNDASLLVSIAVVR